MEVKFIKTESSNYDGSNEFVYLFVFRALDIDDDILLEEILKQFLRVGPEEVEANRQTSHPAQKHDVDRVVSPLDDHVIHRHHVEKGAVQQLPYEEVFRVHLRSIVVETLDVS